MNMMLSVTRKMAFLILTFALFLGTNARDIKVKENSRTDIEVRTNTYQSLAFQNSLDLIRTYKINTELGIFSELVVKGYSSSNTVGSPKLPISRKLIEIPFGASPEVRIISFNVEEYSLADLGILNPVIPTQPPQPKDGSYVPFEYDDNAYSSNEFIGQELVSVEVLGVMRGLRIARVDIAPVQYNPVTGMIRVYSDIEAEVVFTGGDVMTTLEEKEKEHCSIFQLGS